MHIALIDYRRLWRRVWDLRENMTTYDAAYVSLAEYLEEPLATLDGRMVRSPGPRCEFLTFPSLDPVAPQHRAYGCE